MTPSSVHSRRAFLQFLAALGLPMSWSQKLASHAAVAPSGAQPKPAITPILSELDYSQVQLCDSVLNLQFVSTIDALMQISDDTMLKPYRERAGLPAPGKEMGGWYENFAGFDWHSQDFRGFAPGHCFGQWLSALARAYSITGQDVLKQRVAGLVVEYSKTISPKFYENARFPAYTYDKLARGLLDAYLLTNNQDAWQALHKTTDTAVPFLPTSVVDHPPPPAGGDLSYTWDESYTLPENMFIIYTNGGGERYLELARRFMLDSMFGPLARGENALADKHAYSHANALGSAAQAYLVLGSNEHLAAAENGFDIICKSQSYATGGWGPNETFVEIGKGKLGESLTTTHNSFETPCGSYAHFKLARYLLCITGDTRYGDSMERVLYNTVLGAKPFQADGRTFYYSDNNFHAKKVYHKDKCPCCAGTMPQVVCDYHKNIYFRSSTGLLINFYVNSKVSWKQDGNLVSIEQRTKYPLDQTALFEIKTTHPHHFALSFRIPAWAENAAIQINSGAPQPVPSGSFARLERTWRSGDNVHINMPASLRLESVDPQHPDVVALMHGPLVLFALTDNQPPLTRKQLLSARPLDDPRGTWVVETDPVNPLHMVPFTAITDEAYTTYVTVPD